MAGNNVSIISVRISNFRCLKSTQIDLSRLTVLVGENNSGKTSLLEALNVALGTSRRAASTQDIYLEANEPKPPKNRVAIIDVLIRPSNDGKIVSTFPTGFWLSLWGNAIVQDEDDNDLLAIRAQIKWDRVRSEYSIDRRFLKEWLTEGDWTAAQINEVAGPVATRHLEPLSVFYLDAQRDVQKEMSSRSSFWNSLVGDPNLDPTLVKKVEQALSELNKEILTNSQVLKHVETELQDLNQVSQIDGRVSISSVARQLEDLKRGMDIHFAMSGAPNFSIETYGMGTRSLAAILVFRAYAVWKKKQSNYADIHSLLLLEEPEAHLHPQAQRALSAIVNAMPGQCIISSHSPYVVSHCDVQDFRYFRKVSAEAKVRQLESLGDEALTDIKHAVMLTRGDLFFARCIILCEGLTEEVSLPLFAEKYWGANIGSLGISIISVGGQRYHPFVYIANSLGIPWYIFSDGDEASVKSATKLVKENSESGSTDRLISIPEGANFEGMFCTTELLDATVEAICDIEACNESHRTALKKELSAADHIALRNRLKSHKPHFSHPVTNRVLELKSEIRYPGPVKILLDRVSKELNLSKKDR